MRDAAGEATEGGVSSASAVLEKIPQTFNLEFLEMLVENILDDHSSSAPGAFSLELLPDTSLAVVTFQSEQGKRLFVHQAATDTEHISKGTICVLLLFLRDL